MHQPQNHDEFMGFFTAFLGSLTDGDLAEFANSGIRNLTADIAAGDDSLVTADVVMAQIVHTEMILRNMDLDALDFFNRLNGLYPVNLDGLTYSEYVTKIHALWDGLNNK
jgi:hypothetical protein